MGLKNPEHGFAREDFGDTRFMPSVLTPESRGGRLGRGGLVEPCDNLSFTEPRYTPLVYLPHYRDSLGDLFELAIL
jgi:hypothetical protein